MQNTQGPRASQALNSQGMSQLQSQALAPARATSSAKPRLSANFKIPSSFSLCNSMESKASQPLTEKSPAKPVSKVDISRLLELLKATKVAEQQGRIVGAVSAS